MGMYYNVRKTSSTLILGFLAAGCTHTWVAGPHAQGDFAQIRAQCSIMARHGGNNISVIGSTRFVAGALVGNAIGNAIQAHADFNDCMEASGFLIADGQPPATVAYAPLPLPSPQRTVAPSYASVPAPIELASQPSPTAIQPFPVTQAQPSYRDGVGLVQPTSSGGDPTYTWPKAD
jgi:hypothetical protein